VDNQQLKVIIMRKLSLVMALLFTVAMTAGAQDIMGGHFKKCLVIGAHPDDPESMCGGTMLKLKEQGCEVVSVYLTQGEGGIPGKSQTEAREIRHAEALKACEVMGVRPVFMTQIDGYTEINRERYAEMKAVIEQEKPDIVITHWPIDSHRDHRNCALLVYDAWRMTGHSFDLYYVEVMTGNQTQNFHPTSYVDITSVRDKKLEGYLCHKSQKLEGNIAKYHDPMEMMRGLEYHCKYAEAFVKQIWRKE